VFLLKAMTSDSKSLPDATTANPKWEVRYILSGSSPSDHRAHRHTQHGKVWRKKSSASRVLAALASPPATKALDPDLYSRHSLRHAVYAILLQFGVETAGGLIQVVIGFAGGSGCFLTKRSGFLLKAPSRVFWRAAWIASV
jgi:hypothetical protein